MTIKVKSALESHYPITHGGLLSRKLHVLDAIDFSSNVTPAGMPRQVKDIIKKNIKKIENYPDIHSSDLLYALKNYTGLSPSQIIVGNGAIEILYNFCNAFLSKNTPVLIPIPTFGEYEIVSKLNDCKILFFETMDLENNLDSFIEKIPKNGCVFICNPNNPTGKLIPKQKILKIILKAKKQNSLIFIDECFIELVPDSDESIILNVTKFNNLLVLRSLTKSFGLAGLRIGYAASSKYIISILKKSKIPWSVNLIAEQAAITALKNSSHISKSKTIISKEYKFLKNKIAMINGFDCINSSTNFILIKTKYDSTVVQKKLLKYKILVRDCKNFTGLDNHFIRISIKSHRDNLKLVNALKEIS